MSVGWGITVFESLDEDCSLTFYIQHEAPGADNESNWLPANNSKYTP